MATIDKLPDTNRKAIENACNLGKAFNTLGKEDATKFYKFTELASTAFKALETFAGMEAATTFHSTCAVIKYTGKILQSENLMHDFLSGGIFAPSSDPKKAGCYLARTDHLGKNTYWRNSLYVIKIGSLTAGAVCQTYLIGKKILFPRFFSLAGAQFTRTVALTAAKIGGNRAGVMAATATHIGANAVKNYGLLVFLAFEAYQGWHRYQEAAASTANEGAANLDKAKCVELGLKFAANTGKVLILASITIFNAPAAVVVGVSLVVCFIDLADVYQAAQIKAFENLVKKNAGKLLDRVINELQTKPEDTKNKPLEGQVETVLNVNKTLCDELKKRSATINQYKDKYGELEEEGS